jgi:hypothetical protein
VGVEVVGYFTKARLKVKSSFMIHIFSTVSDPSACFGYKRVNIRSDNTAIQHSRYINEMLCDIHEKSAATAHTAQKQNQHYKPSNLP